MRGPSASHGAASLATDGIGNPRPRLEPRITSFKKCKINESISEALTNEFARCFGLGPGVPIPSVKRSLPEL